MASDVDGRRFAVSHLEDLSSWPEESGVPGEQFCLLLLIEHPTPDMEIIKSFAFHALRQGMVYLSVWGPDSGWVEDVVDQVYEDGLAGLAIPSAPLVTTSHRDIQEAFLFFENDAHPQGADNCALWWVVSVGESGQAAEGATSNLGLRHNLTTIGW